MRSIGVHRESGSTNLASDTNSHNQYLASQREKARQHVRTNMIKTFKDENNYIKKTQQPFDNKYIKKSCNILDSSQRTSIVSSDLKQETFNRTTFNGNLNTNIVKSALSRVRNSGCIPPKKKK
jgi:hypothetical protein